MNEIYSVFDSKAEYYMPFFVERNDMTAIRALEAAMQPGHPLWANATDYSLFHIGTWDQETGNIRVTGPKHITDAWIVKAKLTNDKENE